MGKNRIEIETEVQFLSESRRPLTGPARILIRGNLLVLIRSTRQHIHSVYYSLQGATFSQKKKRIVAKRLYIILASALISALIAILLGYMAPNPTAFYSAIGMAFLAMAILAMAPLTLIFPIQNLHLNLNGPEEVETLVIRDDPEQNTALDELLPRLTPLSNGVDAHKSMPVGEILTDWCDAYPIQFIGKRSAVVCSASLGLFGVVATVLSIFDIQLGWGTTMLILFVIPILLVDAYTLFQYSQNHSLWQTAPNRRGAMTALSKGNVAETESHLANILAAHPDDIDARFLLAHHCVIGGDYVAARNCVDLVNVNELEFRTWMTAQIALIEDLEAGLVPTMPLEADPNTG